MKRISASLRWSILQGLQVRMTLSYLWITFIFILVLETLVFAFLILFVSKALIPFVEPSLDNTALHYAYKASLQTQGTSLNPQSTFQPNQSGTIEPSQDDLSTYYMLRMPYITNVATYTNPIRFALLINPNGQIVASTYPAQYPTNSSISGLIAKDTHFIMQSLKNGKANYAVDKTPNTLSVYTIRLTEIVWSTKHLPAGVIYIYMTFGVPSMSINAVPVLLFNSALLYLFIMTPIGGLFGLLTTRSVVRRIHHLVAATTRFATGDFTQRVRISRNDEISQLEQQFNRMAGQLVDSIIKQRELAEQNARLEERSRISRELHDAISQDLFSLSLIAGGLQSALPTASALQLQIKTLQKTTENMMREMRALLLELRPTQLEQLTLNEALSELAEAYQTRLGISVNTCIEQVSLPTKTEHVLLRITQEAFTNAIRHAHANTITLSLIAQNQQIDLSICDNGTGFQADEAGMHHGLGLQMMHERVHELQGSIEIESTPGQGSNIHIRIPEDGEKDDTCRYN